MLAQAEYKTKPLLAYSNKKRKLQQLQLARGEYICSLWPLQCPYTCTCVSLSHSAQTRTLSKSSPNTLCVHIQCLGIDNTTCNSTPRRPWGQDQHNAHTLYNKYTTVTIFDNVNWVSSCKCINVNRLEAFPVN